MQNLSILLEILLHGKFGKNATYSVDRTVNKVGYDCTLVLVDGSPRLPNGTFRQDQRIRCLEGANLPAACPVCLLSGDLSRI